MTDCIFCKIIKGEIPSYKIYEDEHTYAFLDISNDCLGHTLVIPKNHTANIFETNEDDLTNVIKTCKTLSKHYTSLGFEGVNIQNNNGKSAGQSVFHLHFHILPRGISNDALEKLNLNRSNLDLKSISDAFFTKNWHSIVDKLLFIC